MIAIYGDKQRQSVLKENVEGAKQQDTTIQQTSICGESMTVDWERVHQHLVILQQQECKMRMKCNGSKPAHCHISTDVTERESLPLYWFNVLSGSQYPRVVLSGIMLCSLSLHEIEYFSSAVLAYIVPVIQLAHDRWLLHKYMYHVQAIFLIDAIVPGEGMESRVRDGLIICGLSSLSANDSWTLVGKVLGLVIAL